jgi:hypothetical protein
MQGLWKKEGSRGAMGSKGGEKGIAWERQRRGREVQGSEAGDEGKYPQKGRFW